MNYPTNVNRPIQVVDAQVHPTYVPGREGESSGAISPKFFFGVLRRWWKQSMLLGVVLASIAGSVVLWTTTPVYEAKALFRVRPQFVLARDTNERADKVMQTQLELIKSAPVLADAVTSTDIAGLPIFHGVIDKADWLRGHIAVKPVGRSELFTLGLTNEHRECVHKVVNAVKDSYVELINNEAVRQSQQLLEVLDAEKDRRRREIEEKRQRLRMLTKDSGGQAALTSKAVGVSTGPSAALQTQITSLQQTLMEKEMEGLMADAELKADEAKYASGDKSIPEKMLKAGIDARPEILALEGEKQKIANEKAANIKTAAQSYLKTFDDKIANLEKQIEEKRKDLVPAVTKTLSENYTANVEQMLNQSREKLAQLKRQTEVVKKKLVEARKDLQDLGTTSLEAEFLQKDILVDEEFFNKVSNRAEAIRTEAWAQSDVRLMSEAVQPQQPLNSNVFIKVIGIGAIFFCLPFAAFGAWEFRLQRVSDVSEFSVAANLPVVGEISSLPVRAKLLPGGTQKFEETLSRFEESIEYLRTSILIERRCSQLRSLVVCSASSREGKSTISAHLASSIARTIGGRILVIDGDMRRPNLHRLLDFENEIGLVDFLADRVKLEDVVKTTWIDNLDFLPAGVLDTPVAVLLATDRFKQLLDWAHERYEFVLIDVPPILPVSDGLLIARHADAAIFCGLRDVSTSQGVTRACMKLKSAGVNVIGTVFSGVPTRQYGSSNSYYYYRVQSKA